MIGFSRKIINYNKSSYYPKDQYYSKLALKYDNPKFLCKLYKSEHLKVKWTDKHLVFANDMEFGTDINEIIKSHGKPNFIYKNSKNSNYKILLYKLMIGGFKTKCELHFLDNKLFFFNYLFTFLTMEDKSELVKLLGRKYFNDQTTDIFKFKIIDKNNNILVAEDSMDISIGYMSGDHSIYQTLKFDIEQARHNKKQKDLYKINQLYNCL